MSSNNLIPFSKIDKERHIELSRKGGIASGVSRRKKRDEVHAKALERAADDKLYSESLELLVQCAKLLSEAYDGDLW